ncbi:hypothetical protein CN378_18815 [Bacillus sp. AFS015802]|uniref:hypothetical protein n=1 Tax=Bacillus sp. AFS015802 TaxID=2033486 RepID=UPI000BF7A4EF|nr:hypothetical protein [Bacillus sp. AFS015802]PFA63087.1 hypothetical protein CN378_18815 [Bacillus sp. AFS015802]
MSSKKSTILSTCTLVLPWFTAPLLGKNTFVRFTSVAVFTNVVWSFLSIIASNKRWWKADPFFWKKTKIDLPFVGGMFFITTLWVFKWTFGDFRKYFALNALIDFLLAFPIVKFYDKMGAFKLRKMSNLFFYLIILSLAVLIYFYQCILEKVIQWPGKKAENM